MSIALVLAWHSAPTNPLPGFDQLWRIDAGNLGVRVFFVISGFLITSLLASEERRRGRVSLERFFFRRAFRLMPALYAFLAAMGVVALLGISEIGADDIAVSGAYLSNYVKVPWDLGHTWSLAVEAQFYIVWPTAIAVLGFRRALGFAALTMLASPVARGVAEILGSWPANPRYTLECVGDALAAGALLAGFRYSSWEPGWYGRWMDSRSIAAWPLVILGAAAMNVRFPLFAAVAGVTILNVAIAVWIDRLLRHPTRDLGRLLNLPWVMFVGVLSYSLYLWQQPFFREGGRFYLPWNLLVSLGIAYVSYRWVEQPANRVRTAIEERLWPRAQPAPAEGGGA